MRFEHLIEINSPSITLQTVVPAFTLQQLWQGLMARAQTPQRFPNGPDRCDCVDIEPGRFARTVYFGQHVLQDEVRATPLTQLQFTPQAHGETAPIELRISIEEPQPGQMVLRFVYQALLEQTTEEAKYNDYRHSAWLHNDRDMVSTLRQWLADGSLTALGVAVVNRQSQLGLMDLT